MSQRHCFCCCCLVTESCSTLCNPVDWDAKPPCPSPTPGVHWDSRPLSQWCHLTISSSVVPFSSCPQSFPASGSFQTSQLFASGGQSIRALASVFPMNIHILYDWLVWSPCSPRDSQECSPTPQFKSINSSALSFLHSPTLTSIHDYWKNHSFDYTNLCWQSNVSAQVINSEMTFFVF